jgi:hypothetical protein
MGELSVAEVVNWNGSLTLESTGFEAERKHLFFRI